MNRAFSHAEDMQDMATAYYASTQVVAFIAERWGMPKIRRMLELWGEGKRTPEVLQEALGVSAEEVDRGFRAKLADKLSRYKNQFAPPTRAGDVGPAEAAVTAAPNDAEKRAQLALSLMGAGEEKRAREAIAAALRLDPKQPVALWLSAQLAKTSNDRAGAARALQAMIAAGHDGYAVQLALADALPTPGEQRTALEAAHRFDPLQASPLRRLADMAGDAHDADLELSALRNLVVLEENDGDSYRRLITLLLSKNENDEARRMGESALYVDMESSETHRLYAEALASVGARKDAIFELESAVRATGSPSELAQSHLRLADLLEVSGDRSAAQAHRKTAATLGGEARTGPI
jgi:predicted Zn-dependent protease